MPCYPRHDTGNGSPHWTTVHRCGAGPCTPYILDPWQSQVIVSIPCPTNRITQHRHLPWILPCWIRSGEGSWSSTRCIKHPSVCIACSSPPRGSTQEWLNSAILVAQHRHCCGGGWGQSCCFKWAHRPTNWQFPLSTADSIRHDISTSTRCPCRIYPAGSTFWLLHYYIWPILTFNPWGPQWGIFSNHTPTSQLLKTSPKWSQHFHSKLSLSLV